MVCKYFPNPDSHEFLGDDEKASSSATAAASTNTASKSQDSDQDESMETETIPETAAAAGERETDKENGEEVEQKMETATLTDAGGASNGGSGGDAKEEGEGEEKNGEGGEKAKPLEKVEQEYNPLIVRRSNRAIKPTKDIDLYLLGAQFGIDVEGSDADSSDQEFAPAVESDREFQHFTLILVLCWYDNY